MKNQTRKSQEWDASAGLGMSGTKRGRRGLAVGLLFFLAVLLLAVPAFAASGGDEGGGSRGGRYAPLVKQMSSVVFIICLLLLKTARVAGAIVAGAVCPKAVERARGLVSEHPIRMFLLGVADFVASAVILVVLVKLSFPPFNFVALVLMVLMMALTVLGSTGIYGCLGRRIGRGAAPRGDTGEILRGGATLETATLIPILGWVADTIVFCMAFGVGVLLLFKERGAVFSDASETSEPREEEGKEKP